MLVWRILRLDGQLGIRAIAAPKTGSEIRTRDVSKGRAAERACVPCAGLHGLFHPSILALGGGARPYRGAWGYSAWACWRGCTHSWGASTNRHHPLRSVLSGFWQMASEFSSSSPSGRRSGCSEFRPGRSASSCGSRRRSSPPSESRNMTIGSLRRRHSRTKACSNPMTLLWARTRSADSARIPVALSNRCSDEVAHGHGGGSYGRCGPSPPIRLPSARGPAVSACLLHRRHATRASLRAQSPEKHAKEITE